MTTLQPTGPTILVIHASATLRGVARHFLEQEGYRVELATDGAEALALLARHTPALVVCSAHGPGLPGLRLCALMRRSRRYCAIPVVLLDAGGSMVARARCALAGATAILPEPFVRGALLATVRAHLAPPAVAAASETHDMLSGS